MEVAYAGWAKKATPLSTTSI